MYQGDYKDGLRHGYGEYFWNPGGKYFGEWRNDRRHGRGVFYDHNGKRSDSTYKDDKRMCNIPVERVSSFKAGG